MKQIIYSEGIFIIIACSCRNSGNNTQSAQDTLNYAGAYEGTIPCADCPGIDLSLTLSYDGNYTKKMTYRDREPDNVFSTSGKFLWDSTGTVITLTGNADGEKFKVVTGEILMLDIEGNDITGEFSDMYRIKQVETVQK
jgi:uncharacterized lipoprotein NlpE involved in copper resistance